MKDFLKQIAQPLKDNPAGADPRYSDNFFAIKQEIEKLGEVDYARVQQKCQNMLINEAKDLRIAGYLILAVTYINGLDGLIESLQAYQILIKNFWPHIHPQKETARLAALQWLNNPRLLMFLQKDQDINANKLQILAATINELNKHIKKYAGKDAATFSILDEWLAKQQQKLQSCKPTMQENPVEISQDINSDKDVENKCKQIINYYFEKQAYLSAAAFARALRWSAMYLPSHENYKTRIPAPRTEAINKLESLINTNNYLAIYTQCEELFLEPAGHLFLDLQYHAYLAAKEIDPDNLAIFIESEIINLIQRIPLLPELKFVDNKPFANEQTQGWLNNLIGNETIPEANNNLNINDIIHEAKANSKKLSSQLNSINQLPWQNAQEKFLQQQAIAKLCMQNKRVDLAIPVLENLAEQIKKHNLSSWHPELAMAVWNDLYQALNSNLKKLNEPIRSKTLQKIDEIFAQMCQNNIVYTIKLTG